MSHYEDKERPGRIMTKKVMCGSVPVGGGSPVSIQSMTNTDTRDVRASAEQARSLADAGCDIVRIAVPDMEAARAFGRIKAALPDIPLVADIHFDHRLALEAINQGADKIRINPGNIGRIEDLEKIAKAAAGRGIPIRVGVNSGSLQKDILKKNGGVTAEGLAESAMRSIKLLENMGFEDLVVSVKASDAAMNFRACMILSQKTEHPMHIGVTEAGTPEAGKIKSAVGLGALLLSGVGDTVRVSLTGDPLEEVIAAKKILSAAGLRKEPIDLISCPTCGRTHTDLAAAVSRIEKSLAAVGEKRSSMGLPGLTVAVMGCEVNGPGEAREADIGAAFGKGRCILFSKGRIIKTINDRDITEEIVRMAENYENIQNDTYDKA